MFLPKGKPICLDTLDQGQLFIIFFSPFVNVALELSCFFG